MQLGWQCSFAVYHVHSVRMHVLHDSVLEPVRVEWLTVLCVRVLSLLLRHVELLSVDLVLAQQ